MTVFIEFEPLGRRGNCPTGKSILECAHELGVDLVSICGGQGTCNRCKIQLITGSVSDPTTRDRKVFSPAELEQGYRLACQTYPHSDCKLRVPPESLTATQRTQIEGQEVTVSLAPMVSGYHLVLDAPTLSDLLADDQRVLNSIKQQHNVEASSIDLPVLRTLSQELRRSNWEVQISVRGSEVIAVGPWPSRQLGLAVDLGTTKIAGYLVDLEDGNTLASRGVMNPQIAYGENVVARILQTGSPAGAAKMQDLVVGALNQLAGELCAEVGAQPGGLVEAVVVGNTAMHHLFLGLPAAQLGLAPYLPAVRDALDLKARDVGLHMAPGAYVHLLPNVAGFVGADHVAMLLATDVAQAEGIVLALDIGTNTEVCLKNRGQMMSVSCASGPAFEGAHIKHGMRASDGAIERVRLYDGQIEYQTIAGAPPVGICGSGIIDAMAQLYLGGVINRMGGMKDHPQTRLRDGQREFILVSEAERGGRQAICITQEDVRELQLAKGAIRAGIEALLKRNGLVASDIDQVIIAGAFGTYIDISSAMDIGMLPRLPLDRFQQVGNAAGMGAKLALISKEKRLEARNLGLGADYLELATEPNFSTDFIQATLLG